MSIENKILILLFQICLFQISFAQDFSSNTCSLLTYDFLDASFETHTPTIVFENADTSQFLSIKNTPLLNDYYDSYFKLNDVNSKLNFNYQIFEKQKFKSIIEIDTNLSFKPYYFKSKELNEQLIIPQITFVKNTFTDYNDYIRGCGPLEDGITKTVNSRDLMLSNIVDNFINNVVFKNRGPLNMIFHPDN
jgi:hypothetical protein